MNSWPRRLLLLLGLGLAMGAVLALFMFWRTPSGGNPVVIYGTAVPALPTFNAAQVSQGATLYAENCARCHGSNLEGQPNWEQTLPDGSLPAPPHDDSGHTWHHTDEKLMDIIARGGQAVYGDEIVKSNMPAFGDVLNDSERVAILDFIKSHWSKDHQEYQWWITARD